MKLKFIGDPVELQNGGALSRQVIDIEGVLFVMGVATDASGLSQRMRDKLAKNSHFEVVADEVPAPAEESAKPEVKAGAKAKAAKPSDGEE